MLVSLSFVVLVLTQTPALAASQHEHDAHRLVTIKGRVACFDAAGHQVKAEDECKPEGARFLLTAVDGKQYRFLSGDVETAIFTDPRVRQRELQITGRLHSDDQVELIRVQSIKGSKLYDIFYYCELCNIKAYAPGLCPCCRNEMEFREMPSQAP